MRELKNAVHRAFILADEEVGPECLPGVVAGRLNSSERRADGGGPALRLQVGSSVADAERRLIEATLEHFEGNKQKAAEVLEISLKTLYNRLNAYAWE